MLGHTQVEDASGHGSPSVDVGSMAAHSLQVGIF